MSNSYYNSTFTAAIGTLARSSTLRSQFLLVETGVTAMEAALAPKASPAFTGTASFSGNVGVGASSPLTRLDTRNADAFSSVVSDTTLNNNTNTVARLSFTTDPVSAITGGTGVALALSATPNRGEVFLVGTHPTTSKDAGDFAVWTTLAGVASERMRVDSSGNIGIGNSGPTQAVVVGSDSRTTDAVVRANTLGASANPAFSLRSSGVIAWDMAVDGSGYLRITRNTAGYGTAQLAAAAKVSLSDSGDLIATVNSGAPALTLNGTMTLELTSDTQLTIKVRGSDGTTRSVALTLA
jgi:hypothetical protein